MLDRAHALLDGAPESVMAALDDLAEIAQILARRYPQIPLYFDLGELRGYHYHTGVVFAAFVPGIGQSVAQGGRYDDIGGDFGRARPATGFSTDLRFLVQRGRVGLDQARTAIWAPHSSEAGLHEQIAQLRRQGERVIMALPGQTSAEAADFGCDRVLGFQAGSWSITALNS